MKSLFSFLGVIAVLAAAPQFASADTIFAFTTTEGVSEGDLDVTSEANLLSFSTGTTIYSGLTGIALASGAPADTLFTGTAAASASAAIGDLNLATGTLNTGTAARYDLSATATQSALAAGGTFFIFGNGNGGVGDPIGGSGGTTPPNTLSFRDATDAVIGTVPTDFFFQDGDPLGDRAPNLATFDFTRGNGNALNNRTISGAVFEISEIDFTGAFTIADATSFSAGSGTFDGQDFGIATIATPIATIPEPSSAILLVSGLGTFLVRRRRK